VIWRWLAVGLLLQAGSALAGPASPSEGTRWRENYFPNVVLTDHDGKKVKFYDDLIKDKVVAISFIFTQCTGPCPAETANLRKVQKLLGDQVGKEVFMLSISLDPKHDQPQQLKAYRKKFGITNGWRFLTGKISDVNLIRSKLGLYSARNGREKLEDHTITFIVGNEAKGQWIKRSAFDHPGVLAQLLGVSLQSLPKERTGQLSYATAAQVPLLSKGESLFRTRCVLCHSSTSEDSVGPALAGVTSRRDRKWLSRWILEPDRMLAEGDPIAKELFAQYREVNMPNFKLSPEEVEAIVQYLETLK